MPVNSLFFVLTSDHLSQFVDYLRVERGAAENTVLNYSSDLRRLFSFLEKRGHTSESATRDDVRAFSLLRKMRLQVNAGSWCSP